MKPMQATILIMLRTNSAASCRLDCYMFILSIGFTNLHCIRELQIFESETQ